MGRGWNTQREEGAAAGMEDTGKRDWSVGSMEGHVEEGDKKKMIPKVLVYTW